jgi:PPM family protein phosphatase
VSELRWAARSDVGRARDRNEDSYFAGDHVFVVADGLGGHNAGDVASSLAIEPFKSLDRRVDGQPSERVSKLLADTVLEANRAVYKRAQSDAKVRGMGTTLTAVAITNGAAHLAHVGDSRCYLLRGGAMNQISNDHTLVARMVQEGKLTAQQAEVHPQRSILTRALGAEPEVDVDSFEVDLLPGDRLLLCSDGLSSVIPEERIREILSSTEELEKGCGLLIDEANAHGGPDNITVVAVEVTGAPPSRSGPPVARRAERIEHAAARRKRRVSVRGIIWALVILLIGLGGFIGFRSWVNRSYYVGVDGNKVAIFRGLPTEIGGLRLHHVEEPTAITIEQVSPELRANLRDGIRVGSLAEARARVADLRLVTPAPSASLTPSPTPSPTPTKT